MDHVENLNWFNPMSCVKICNTSTVHHSHTSMLFIGCIAYCILSLKKNDLNHCYQKEKKEESSCLERGGRGSWRSWYEFMCCHVPCWKSKFIPPHVLRKSSQYFNYASFPYIHTFHWLHCSLHSFLEKKKEKLNHCYKKEKNTLYGALTEPMLELE